MFSNLNLAIAKALVKTIDTPAAVQDLLFSSIKRMAVGTDFNQYVLAQGRLSFNDVPAAAGSLDRPVFGMYFRSHACLQSASPRRETFLTTHHT